MKLSTIETPQLLTKSITAPIPEYVIQQRDAGRGQTLDYISGATVIDILNNTFGYLGWSAEYPQYWKEESEPFFQKETKWFKPDPALATKNAAGENGILMPQSPVVFAKCRLTVHLVRPDGTMHSIVKEAFGSKSVIGKQNEQESTYKAAQTDALKKAASLFGIGLELYRGEEEQAYFNQISMPIIWTEEKRAESEDWAILEGIAKENGWSLDDLDYYVAELTESAYTNLYTLPEVWLTALVEYLQQSSGESEGDEE